MLQRHYFVLLVCLTNPFLIEGNRYKKSKLKFGSIQEDRVKLRPTFKSQDDKQWLKYRNMQGIYGGTLEGPTKDVFKETSKYFEGKLHGGALEGPTKDVFKEASKYFEDKRHTLNNKGKYKNKDDASSKICLLKPGQEYCYGEDAVYVPRLPGSNSRRRQLKQPVKLLAQPQKVILENVNIKIPRRIVF